MILAAIEREWEKTPDLRLGQLLMNRIRLNTNTAPEKEGHFLGGVEDGVLLRILGHETDAEQKYIEEEPAKAKEGWAEWMKQSRERKEREDG